MWSGNEGNWNQTWPGAVPLNDGDVGPNVVFSTISNFPIQGANPQQVDWAALAQQWIQLQQQPQDQPQPQPQPHLQPSLPLQDVANSVENAQICHTEPNENIPPTDNVYSNSGNILPPVQQAGYWNAEQPAWNPAIAPQAWLGPNARPKETFDYGHNPSQGESSFAPSNNAQTYDYNHGGSNDFSFDQQPYNDQYWSQDSNEPTNGEFSKDRSSWQDEHPPETPQIDNIKRKSLPLWIREGLEKMEREKQKKIDLEREKQQKLNSHDDTVDDNEENEQAIWPKRSRFDSESEDDAPIEESRSPDENSNDESPVRTSVKSPSPKDVPVMTEEEREQDILLRMRRMLTEILLEVTNEEIRNIVDDVAQKAKYRKSLETKHLASSSALASIASNLGLGNYESHSEDDYESEKQKNSDSDSDVEAIHEKARRKRLDFDRRQSERIYEEEEEYKPKQDSKSFSDRDSNKYDNTKKESMNSSKDSNLDFSKVSEKDSFKYHFEKKYSEIPGLDVPIKSEDYDRESTPEKSETVKKQKKQSSRSESKSSKKRRKSRSRSASSSKNQRWSRSSSRDRKKSRNSENYSKSRSSKHKRSRSRERHKSRSRSFDRRDRRRSRSRDRRHRSVSYDSSSSSEGNRKRYRSRSRDRGSYSRNKRSHSRDKSRSKKSRRKSRSRSRSNSSRRFNKYKSGKSRSGKKSL